MPSSTFSRSGGSDHLLTWIALVGPAAWLIAFEAVYVLAMGCQRFTPGAHAVVAFMTLVAAGAAWISARWMQPAPSVETPPRTRWLAGASIGLNIWFAISIAALEFPIAIVRPCVP